MNGCCNLDTPVHRKNRLSSAKIKLCRVSHPCTIKSQPRNPLIDCATPRDLRPIARAWPLYNVIRLIARGIMAEIGAIRT